MKILLRKIRLTALYIFLYNLILIISIWLGRCPPRRNLSLQSQEYGHDGLVFLAFAQSSIG